MCSKESNNVLTKISLRDDLKTGYNRFREMHDLGLLGLASYNKISLSVGDLSELVTKSIRNFIGNAVLLFLKNLGKRVFRLHEIAILCLWTLTGLGELTSDNWKPIMDMYSFLLQPNEPFWKVLNEGGSEGKTKRYASLIKAVT